MTRVTDYAQFQTAMFHLRATQERVDMAQLQIASGYKSQDYADLARDTSRLVNMETTHSRVSQFMENNKLVDLRLQTMETNVSQVFDVAGELKTLLVNALNIENGTDLALPAEAQNKLAAVASMLNVQQDGRYLFAGSRTDTPPVDLTQLPTSYTVPTADGDSAGYYQGDSFRFSVRADETFDVAYGLTADATGFERLIRALDIVVKSPPTDRAALQHALDVVNQAIEVIPDLRTEIGSARATLAKVNDRHTEFLLYTEQAIGDIENVDVTETMTKLNADGVSLEASYIAITTLQRLNLLNFLR